MVSFASLKCAESVSANSLTPVLFPALQNPVGNKEECIMTFESLTTTKINAKLTGSTNSISLAGITAEATTPENAKTQIDKILNIINQSVTTNKMTRTITQEATE